MVDMTAGADSFASGLFTRFDLTLLVCEPTVRSVGVYRQYVAYARDFGVQVAVLGKCVKDWPHHTEQAVYFHLRNAVAWANDRAGRDLAAQIDPDFVLGPAALAAAAL